MVLPVILGAAAWEAFWWLARLNKRGATFDRARAAAEATGKPLVVIGAPDGGVTSGYPCGDYTVDLAPSSCPNSIQLDLTRDLLPFSDNSVVALVVCVLEYVSELEPAMAELRRVAGSHVYVVRVEPWTLTAFLYPGATRRVPANIPGAHVF